MAGYNGKSRFVLPRHLQYKSGLNVETIAGDKTMTYLDSQHQIINNNAGGIADIFLPEEKDGANFWFKLDSTSGHNVRILNGSGSDVVNTLVVGKSCWVMCDGTTWHLLIEA